MQKYYPSSPHSGGGGPPPPPPYEDVIPNRLQKLSPQPIVAQPVQSDFPPSGFVRGQNIALNVPPGLEYLAQLDRLFIKQEKEFCEVLCECLPENRYQIKDSRGRVMFKAYEDTGCCNRLCCGATRPFDLNILDLNGREVIHLARPLACQSCCFPCCLQELQVFSPPGRLAGTVEQEWTLGDPQFVVKDTSGNVVLRIWGPVCTCICWDFKIMSADGGQQVGRISKEWSGCARELFTDADKFGIEFPRGLDAKMKAVVVGACLLIDFMYYGK